jgi:FtsZ-binding cell division protein ZapB
MTEEQTKLLSVFEARVRQLVFLCDELKNRNKTLEGQLASLQQAYAVLQTENEQGKAKYDSLKVARIISVKQDDFTGAKARLSKLVKEVDKCIALLNE